MSKSSIEWTEHTWNPIVGCSIVSPGCTNCYAMKMAARIEAMGNQPRYAGTTKKVNGNAVWTGKLAQAPVSVLLAPLKRKKPTTYFVNSMGDLFHEDVPDAWIDRVFAVMALTPQHTYQVLTKRPSRMRDYLIGPHRYDWASALTRMIAEDVVRSDHAAALAVAAIWETLSLPNVWLGVSTERQQEADERIPLLLDTPAAVRFISVEPLLGSIDLHPLADGTNALTSSVGPNLDWVIVGGESGRGARPMDPTWARDLRDQCARARVPFFFKQWGSHAPMTMAKPPCMPRDSEKMVACSKKSAGRLLDGVEHGDMPS